MEKPATPPGEGKREPRRVIREGMRRAQAILVIFVVVVVGWEYVRQLGYERAEGLVVGVRTVVPGRAGDNREFTIRYQWRGEDHVVDVRRGIIDALGQLSDLKAGDRVALALHPKRPEKAIIDTFNQRYGISLSAIAMAVVPLPVFWITRRRLRSR